MFYDYDIRAVGYGRGFVAGRESGACTPRLQARARTLRRARIRRRSIARLDIHRECILFKYVKIM